MNVNHKWQKPTELIINKEIWLQVKDFKNSKSFDRHFIVKQLKNGNDVLIFGNGINGAKPSDLYPTFASALQTDYQTDEYLKPRNMITDLSQKMDYSGIYRGIVVIDKHPENYLKVQVKIAIFPDLGEIWATPVIPLLEDDINNPKVGDAVWISFRDQDPSQPLWLGKIKEENHSSVII
jgi:hypothetical protein